MVEPYTAEKWLLSPGASVGCELESLGLSTAPEAPPRGCFVQAPGTCCARSLAPQGRYKAAWGNAPGGACLGRCPRLLYHAPAGLAPGVAQQVVGLHTRKDAPFFLELHEQPADLPCSMLPSSVNTWTPSRRIVPIATSRPTWIASSCSMTSGSG